MKTCMANMWILSKEITLNSLCVSLKAEKRKLELAEKYKELKSSGKLERYMKRKDKKMTGKERRKMPYRRDMGIEQNAGEDNSFV